MLGSLISDCMECERTLPIKDYGVVFDEVNKSERRSGERF